jgi:hypothetical protein
MTAKVRVFYNIFIKGPEQESRVTAMFREQLRALDPAFHDTNVSVTAIGHRPLTLPGICEHHVNGTEGATLRALWDYCRARDDGDTRVVYLHSKGLLTPGEDNDRLRRFLTEWALSRECAELPGTCDVCSSRMSSHPHPHTPGEGYLSWLVFAYICMVKRNSRCS